MSSSLPTRSSHLHHLPRRLGGLVLLAACVGLAACSKQGDGSSGSGSQVAARVNKEELSVHQINYVLERQPGLKPEQVDAASRTVLERLIDQELAVQRAGELKLDRDPRVMQTLEATRRDVLARAYVDHVGGGVAKPTATEVQAYYDAKPALFKDRKVYNLQELEVQASGENLAALKARAATAKNMQEMAQLIQELKLPVRSKQSTLAAESVPLSLLDKLAAMRPGQAMLLPSRAGAQIVVLSGSRDQGVTLEQARPLIERALLNERKLKAVEDDRKGLRGSGRIEYVGKFAEKPASGAGAADPASAAAETAPSAGLPMPAPAAASADPSALEKGLAGLK